MKVSADRLPEWAVLIYSSASPDIEREAVASLQEVAAARQEDSVVLGAQLGRESGTARYRFTGETADELSRPPEETLPPADMADPATLEDFLRWGMRTFPAKRYVVVMGGHGAGFLGAVTDAARRKMMRPDQMAEALRRSGIHPQVLVLNACLMAQAEVARELSPHAGYLVASQGLEHLEGMPLGRLVERLGDGLSPEEAARALVEETAATPDRLPAASALRLAEMPRLGEALDGLGQAILAHPEMASRLRGHAQALPHFREGRDEDRPLSDYKDLAAFADRLARDPGLAGTALPEAARRVGEAVRDTVVASRARPDLGEVHGLSVYLPTEPLSRTHGPLGDQVEAAYRNLQMARTTSWDEALDVLTGREAPPARRARIPGAAGPATRPR